MPNNNVDVLIIGAGPAGLMCANALARAGIEVRIVDQRPGAIKAGQADGIHSRTIEILQSYGLAERLLREGAQIHRAAMYNPGPQGGIERARRYGWFTTAEARYPFGSCLNQGGIEAIFIDDMESRGVVIDRPTVPTSIEVQEEQTQDGGAYPVKVVLKHLDRKENVVEVVHAKFVLGADGAHSWVRKVMGIKMEGDSTDDVWGVVDIKPDTDFPDVRAFSMIHSLAGASLLIPRERDLLRMYIQLSDTDVVDPRTGRIDKDRTNAEKVLAMAQNIMKPFRMEAVGNIDWWTIYIVGQRVAEKYSISDKVFISGDACHTHSPKAGQGMNASMMDSHNLAWKLAYVLRGWADPSLLQTYESERRKFALDLIQYDREWSAMIAEKNDTPGREERFREMFEKNADFMSGLTLRYEPSSIVNNQFQACAPQIVVGERIPPHVFICAADARPVNIHDMLPADTRFKIVFFVGDITDASIAELVQDLAGRLDKPGSFLQRHDSRAFDVLCVSASSQHAVDYTDFPEVFRSHWSKVLLDDTQLNGRPGDGGFARYKVNPQEGAIVVVRPDGHVGMVAPCDQLDAVDGYFGSFMTSKDK
ncbi:FAD binding domain-containing protein [Trametes elegans]|nr:FAD binding domain-containing protein [Trametes elegans]